MDQEFEELAKLVGKALADRWLRAHEPPRMGCEADRRNAAPKPVVASDSRANPPTPPQREDRNS